ncbi:hypothetical protein FQN50_007127 [Emmonsiellopsis sp. PD_5]|nr:hypothetical protein FQN50_007127 [Emmonsiellopsis sp. PD_5]
MAQPNDTLANLERQRLQLEQSISELRKSLYNWRLWDAEYDELKTEIAALDQDATNNDFLKIGREFGGALVNEDEIKVLLGLKQGVTRTQQQVGDAISRRRDYVQQNVSLLEKRIAAAEKKLDAMLVVEHPSALNEEGLPITDIVEELDEEDRIISSSTKTTGESAPEILEVLKKAGIEKLENEKAGEAHQKQPEETRVPQTQPSMVVDRITPVDEEQISKEDSTKEPGSSASTVQPATLTSSATSVGDSVSNIPAIGSKYSDHSTSSETDHDDDTTMATEIDESPEDAALRREMLQYGLEEVGAVVAELELEESGSEFSIEDEDYMMGDEDDEDEDEHGRSTRRMIDDDYRRQMLELEKKLNARGIQNIGRDTSILPQEVREELEKPPAAMENVPEVPDAKATKKKKKVAFADTLDIAPEPSAAAPSPPIQKQEHRVESPSVPVIQEAIVERTQEEKSEPAPEQAPPKKKVSRFKSARKAAEPTNFESTPSFSTSQPRSHLHSNGPALPLFPAKPSQPKPFSQPIIDPDQPSQQPPRNRAPFPPESKTLADKLVEREVSHESVTPPDPDELDENLHRQEIATEFYKIRNRKIQQEGGFMREDEETEGIVPLDNEGESGEPVKRVSRFMAARMK